MGRGHRHQCLVQDDADHHMCVLLDPREPFYKRDLQKHRDLDHLEPKKAPRTVFGRRKDGTHTMSSPLKEEAAYSAFMKTPEKVRRWGGKELKAARDSTLDARALHQIPDLHDFTSFESMTFGQRQRVLAKLRCLEEKVNIKALPAAVALLAAAIALVTASSREKSSSSTPAPVSASTPAPAPGTSTGVTSTPAPSPTSVATAIPAPSPQNHLDPWAWIQGVLSDPSVLLIPT